MLYVCVFISQNIFHPFKTFTTDWYIVEYGERCIFHGCFTRCFHTSVCVMSGGTFSYPLKHFFYMVKDGVKAYVSPHSRYFQPFTGLWKREGYFAELFFNRWNDNLAECLYGTQIRQIFTDGNWTPLLREGGVPTGRGGRTRMVRPIYII